MADKDHQEFELNPNNIPLATDSLSAPVFYADAIRGLTIAGETTKVNFVQFRQNALTDELVTVHSAIVVVPTSQLPAWVEYLSKVIAKPPFALAESIGEGAVDGG